jgi:hypothetical protein
MNWAGVSIYLGMIALAWELGLAGWILLAAITLTLWGEWWKL